MTKKISDDVPYDGKGKLGQAIQDLKYGVATEQHFSWPRYWQDFVEQLYVDILALEMELQESRGKNVKNKRTGAW